MQKYVKRHMDVAYVDTAAEARFYIQAELAIGNIYPSPSPGFIEMGSGVVVYATVDILVDEDEGSGE
jgi:hypothetical protein